MKLRANCVVNEMLLLCNQNQREKDPKINVGSYVVWHGTIFPSLIPRQSGMGLLYIPQSHSQAVWVWDYIPSGGFGEEQTLEWSGSHYILF